jgi:hypothetical protein
MIFAVIFEMVDSRVAIPSLDNEGLDDSDGISKSKDRTTDLSATLVKGWSRD